MSRRDAQKEFGIPKTNLARWLKGAPNKQGQSAVLNMVEENITVDHNQLMCLELSI